MLQNSLFICYSTPNYSNLTTLCLESLRDISVNNINHLLDNPISYKNTGFQSDLWYYCVRNKINHLINVLSHSTGMATVPCGLTSGMKPHYFIFTDCDIVYIKKNVNEWSNLDNYIVNENNDIFFMRENTSNNVNSGFFIIKNNNLGNIIEFFSEVLRTIDATDKKRMPFGDQSIINNLKNTLNYGFIPNDYVVFGNTIFNKDKALFHHAVFCKDVDDKITQINHIKSSF